MAASFNNPSYHRLPMEDEKEDEDNARRSGGDGTNLRILVAGWYQKQKGNLQSKSDRVYGRNYDASLSTLLHSSTTMSIPMHSCHMSSDVIWARLPQQAQTYSSLHWIEEMCLFVYEKSYHPILVKLHNDKWVLRIYGTCTRWFLDKFFAAWSKEDANVQVIKVENPSWAH